MKIHLLGAEFFVRTDGQTNGKTERYIGITRLIVAFRSFANTLKSQTQICAVWVCFAILMGFVIHEVTVLKLFLCDT